MLFVPLLLLTTPCLKKCGRPHLNKGPIRTKVLWWQFGWLVHGSNADPTSWPAGATGRQLCIGDARFSCLLLAIDDSLEPQLQLFLSLFLEGQHALTHHFTQPGQHHGPPKTGANQHLEVCVQPYQGPPSLRRIFPYSGARKTVFLDPQRCSLGFETVCVFLCFWAVVMEKTFESPLDCKEIQPVQPKGDQSWVFIGRTDVEAETPLLWPPDAKSDSLEKTLNLGKMRVGGEGDDRGWDGWMASLTQWTWVWVNSGSWLWTGRPDMMQSMGSQRVGHDWVTKLNWLYF